MNERIYRLAEDDPAFENGARYALCRPAWAGWAIDGEPAPLVALEYAKFATLEDARHFALKGLGVFSTHPDGIRLDGEMFEPVA